MFKKRKHVNRILAVIEETVNKTTINDFRQYLSGLPTYSKWVICSDYCIDDPNKPNDTATFTIIPYYDDFNNIQTKISDIAPTDIKNTRSIRQDFLNYHKSGKIFHFAYIFGKRCNHVLKNHAKEDIVSYLNETIKMLEKWKINTPCNKDYFEKIIKKIKALIQESNKKSFNQNLLKKIMISNLLAAYTAYLLSKETKVEIIGWFSDRDEIISSFQRIVFDFFHMNYHCLCDRDKIDDSKIKLVITDPTQNGNKNKLWYDELNRLPDFITGTLSDFDFTKNIVSKAKFSTMLEGCIADNDKISILKLYLVSGAFKCERVMVNNI